MSLLARFEEVAELFFTGPFKKTATRLQPVEIAKELVKEMLRHKQVSISQVYVPNVYRVYLHSKDWVPLASFGETFLIELSKYLHQEGERNSYTFLGKPSIELHADDTVNLREMFVEVAFDDSVDIDWREEEGNTREKELEHEKTTIFQDVVKTNFPKEGITSRNLRYILEIIQGPDIGKLFPLDAENIYIGRHAQCELVLTDLEASRRHLKMTQCEQGWLLDDLGSTNGTMVNGQRVSRQLILPGDRIQIGQSILAIKRV